MNSRMNATMREAGQPDSGGAGAGNSGMGSTGIENPNIEKPGTGSGGKRLIILGTAAALLAAVFMLIHVNGHWDYVLPRRGAKLGAIVLTGAAIAVSTVVFQTITNNRILTPSIIGFDSLYLLVQTVIIFGLGGVQAGLAGPRINFIVSVAVMVIFALVLYRMLFSRASRGIHFVLLLGVILGTLFQSLSSVMHVLMDPNEFMFVQDRMFASFNNIRTDLLGVAAVIVAGAGVYSARFLPYLDVLALGRDHAISLGVDYEYVVNRLLMVAAALIAVSTALVGPITFLGLLAANLAYQLLSTFRHTYLIAGAVLVALIALIGGQLIVERVLSFSTTLSVIINFVGGAYFIALLVKESRI